MKNLRIWSLLCLIWMGVLAASAQDTGKEKISLGDAMPAITLSSEIYGKVTPADLKGKAVLVCYVVRSLSDRTGRSSEDLVAEI